MQKEFLSEEYTDWLNRLFKRTINVVLQVEYDMNKFNILFKYVEDYLNSEMADKEVKDYYLNTRYLTYGFTYNDMNIKVTKLSNDDIRVLNPVISSYLVANQDDKTKLGIPTIDINKVREYVLISSKKEEDRALSTIIKTINELESKGIDREVIINDLQIAYAYEVNKDIKEKQSSKGR